MPLVLPSTLKLSQKKRYLKLMLDFLITQKIANDIDCKFIQISTDCVFNGSAGNYKESSKTNATDIYGISKIKGNFR